MITETIPQALDRSHAPTAQHQRVVFSDFDGTITAEETFVALLKAFTPQLSAELMPEMYARRLTLREGVRRLLESIPASQYPEIVEFSRSKTMRPGLPEFLDFLDRHQVPFVVISGGVRGMVETVLGDLQPRMAGIHAVDLDVSQDYCRVIPTYEDGTELVAKVNVMAQYPCQEAIAIGDSITDLNMALAAPVVFARDRLAQYLDEQGKAYIPWNDFFEIRDYLAQRWEK
ncbi:MAG: 2-hydroxy-3-keto-5-methylthiopentenyl-1-phosphate phosphatase [Alkalinema sp. CACIAM 70d]|nr:MAG: 2-hydroxy-3-keto-5-methylthiopentenyl-1-phosphate phosphatase [Alkalinema sp. CACIAM 70d]